MKALLLGLIKFVAVTAPVTWWWMHGGQQIYFKAFIAVSRPLFVILGVTNFPPSMVRDRMLNFLPFIALMAVTPHIPALRRFISTLAGLFLIYLSQVGLAYWAYVGVSQYAKTDPALKVHFFPAEIFSDALPFAVWAIFAGSALGTMLSQIIPPGESNVPDVAASLEREPSSASRED
jgi:hypothetical protein